MTRISIDFSLGEIDLLHIATDALLDCLAMTGGSHDTDKVIALQDRLWKILQENGNKGA
jgi:hypothetical protein